MKQRKWMKLLAVAFAMIFALGQLAGDGLSVSAAKRRTLNVKNVTLTTGTSKQLKVSGIKAGKVKWSSSRKSVASVGRKGKVTAKKPGKATITAKFPGGKLKCRVTVKVGGNGGKPEASKAPAAEAEVTPAATTPKRYPQQNRCRHQHQRMVRYWLRIFHGVEPVRELQRISSPRPVQILSGSKEPCHTAPIIRQQHMGMP